MQNVKQSSLIIIEKISTGMKIASIEHKSNLFSNETVNRELNEKKLNVQHKNEEETISIRWESLMRSARAFGKAARSFEKNNNPTLMFTQSKTKNGSNIGAHWTRNTEYQKIWKKLERTGKSHHSLNNWRNIPIKCMNLRKNFQWMSIGVYTTIPHMHSLAQSVHELHFTFKKVWAREMSRI